MRAGLVSHSSDQGQVGVGRTRSWQRDSRVDQMYIKVVLAMVERMFIKVLAMVEEVICSMH